MDAIAKPTPGSSSESSPLDDVRTGLSLPAISRAFAENLFYVQGKFPAIATKNDLYMALAYTVRDRLLHRWINTIETYLQKSHEPKIVCYRWVQGKYRKYLAAVEGGSARVL